MKPTVVITGSSTGIGRDFARRAVELGWIVVATARNPAKIDLPAAANLHKIALDVTSEESISAFLAAFGRIPLDGPLFLLNNAGLAVAGPLEAVAFEDWRRQLDTNVLGVVRLTQVLLPKIRESRGRIVNIGSVSGHIATPFLGPYAASKFALRALTDSLRRELKSLGVKVVLIEPGPIKTPIWEKSKNDSQSLAHSMTEEQKRIYGPALEPFSASAMQAGQSGLPVEKVTAAIEKALTVANPRPHMAPSFGHRLTSMLGDLLPASVLDFLVGQSFRGHRPR